MLTLVRNKKIISLDSTSKYMRIVYKYTTHCIAQVKLRKYEINKFKKKNKKKTICMCDFESPSV